MIKLDIFSQIIAIINSVFLGAFLTLIYDLFSFLEISLGIKHYKCKKPSKFELPYTPSTIKKVALFFLDILFCLVITPICAIFLYSVNFGILRWYYAVASVVGALVYRISIGIFVKAVLSFLGRMLRYFLHFVGKKAIGIIKSVVRKIKKPRKKPKVKSNERKCICSSGAVKIKRQS